MIAYKGPPLPPKAANAIDKDNAHFKAPTAVFP